MLISLGENQYISVDGKELPTKQGYVGHHLDDANIPDKGVVEIVTGIYHNGIDKFIEAPSKVLFRGSKVEFLLWQEEHNGW